MADWQMMGRIVFIVPYPFIPPRNGGHRAAYGFAEFLSRQRPLTVYATYEDAAVGAPFPVEGLFTHRPWKYINPAVTLRLWRHLWRDRPQLIILHQHFMGLLVVPLAWVLRIPLAVYVQNLEYRRFRGLGRKWWPLMFVFEWWVYFNCRYLFFISPDELESGRKAFGLREGKCSAVPYGTPFDRQPIADPQESREIRKRHQFLPGETLILFFGPQSYLPNLEAVERIAREIAPRLARRADFPFRFVICGGGLPANRAWVRDAPHLSYLGYVPEIESYVQAADLVINPVNKGGGVKTKLIEAIALGKTVISSRTGAQGVDPTRCGDKLIKVEDEDYDDFVRAILQGLTTANSPTPPEFYDAYFWGNTVRAVLEVVK